jgi:eukaryotic-like serine/threonine-protein kinase
MSLKFWQYPWFIGLCAGLILLFLYAGGTLTPWENALYQGLQHLNARSPGDEITVVAIDARSITAAGVAPWSQRHYARLVDALFAADTRLTVLSDPLDASAPSSALSQMQAILQEYEHSNLISAHALDNELLAHELTLLRTRLRNVYQVLDTEAMLHASLKKSRNIILGIPFQATTSAHTHALADSVRPYALTQVRAAFGNTANHAAISAQNLQPPPQNFLNAAQSVGLMPTDWHDWQQNPLVLAYGNHYLPSLALSIAAQARHLKLADIEIELGKGIRWGAHTITTDPHLSVRPFLYDSAKINTLSALDVLEGRADMSLLRHKIILVGTTIPNPTQLNQYAAGEFVAPVMHLAHTLASILNNDLLHLFPYADGIQWGLSILILIYLIAILPRIPAFRGLLFSFIGLSIMLALSWGWLALGQQWLPLLLPCLILSAAQSGYLLQHYWRKNRPGQHSGEHIARLRLEGLAYQGQGKLEQAFEKFAQCPTDELILSLLYNLALDFERRRQNREASAVYRYISACNSNFRDIEQRMERLGKVRKAPQVSSTNLNQWLDNEHDFKPTLGRYQIERRLAKGAMGGEVYLGKDPKLDRIVALKTLALGEEFEGEELLEVTARFFREAAAAGRLNHPNIIAVYDAGEENDLAYISMEFFKGSDLTPFTKADNLLPVTVVLDIMLSASNALDYAHRQGVVHRDIKPANIMYNRATGSLKLTDFGIARIMDSKKTKTGIILGTPSYMSPEQLAGKTVDGRTDLFSLGITLYQLLTAQLPFNADSMASLMFKIASEAAPDILTLRADLPLCLKAIIDTLLQKEPAQRYASGAELAIALRECKAQIVANAHILPSTGITP